MDPGKFIKQFDEYKQISKTGSRAMIILIYLLDGPKSFEEIRDFLIACGIVTREYSVDTIRIDLNTLKLMGCEITKATKRNNHKYGLISYPFGLKLTSKDVDAIRLIYKKLSKNISPAKLLKYHKLFEKIAEIVDNEEIKEELLGISVFKRENISIIEDLVSDEHKYNKITISYFPPNHNEPVEYDITLETLGMRNGKLYVFCYNHTLGSRSFLNVSRIKFVVTKMFDRNSCYGLDIRIKFKLKNYKKYKLEENEYITESNGNDAIIAGYYFNNFIAVQRILSFASDCTVISPEEVKSEIIDKLKEMRSIYES